VVAARILVRGVADQEVVRVARWRGRPGGLLVPSRGELMRRGKEEKGLAAKATPVSALRRRRLPSRVRLKRVAGLVVVAVTRAGGPGDLRRGREDVLRLGGRQLAPRRAKATRQALLGQLAQDGQRSAPGATAGLGQPWPEMIGLIKRREPHLRHGAA
jgi:hypothetical protein